MVLANGKDCGDKFFDSGVVIGGQQAFGVVETCCCCDVDFSFDSSLIVYGLNYY